MISCYIRTHAMEQIEKENQNETTSAHYEKQITVVVQVVVVRILKRG